MTRPTKTNGNSYADKFKPALLLGGLTLASAANNTYLVERRESYDAGGMPMLHLNTEATGGNAVFYLDTLDPEIRPVLRNVEVVGETQYDAYLVELQQEGQGLTVLMLQDTKEQVLCHACFMPLSTLDDVICGANAEGPMKIKLPASNLVRLSITMEASSTSEVLFKTHPPHIHLDGLTDDEKIHLTSKLEDSVAKEIAHYVAQLLEMQPGSFHAPQIPDRELRKPLVSADVALSPINIKRVALGCTLVATCLGLALTGVGGAWSTSSTMSVVGAVMAAVGGAGRNIVALSGLFGTPPVPPGLVSTGASYNVTIHFLDELAGTGRRANITFD